MNVKKVLPILLLLIMAVITVAIKRCNNTEATDVRRSEPVQNESGERSQRGRVAPRSDTKATEGLDRNGKLFYTKHAKCRMKCRQITQKEVKDILEKGTINYKKTNLDDPRGPSYAVEGYTSDRQHVRIIFAPKEKHITVVTVIDLEVEYECSCN